MDWSSFRFIDLFAGIGGIRLGFERVGGHCVFSSEFDEDACKTYEANFGEHPSGDITKISASEIPEHEILLAGFPCQAFSIIGKREGFANETSGTLFFEIERILREKQPPAFMLENVRNLMAHDGGNTFRIIREHLEHLGYHVYAKVLNALDYGVPQKRERIIIVGFREDVPFEFPKPVPEEERKHLPDILEKKAAAKYYVREIIRDSRLARLKDKNYPKPYISHENISGSITPHLYSSALRAGASANYILINDERRPTEREMLRLQGFPDTYKVVLPYGKVKKQCGNSVAVPVIEAVARQMVQALQAYYGEEDGMTRKEAKEKLDKVLNKSRVHFYKPIQIAEILYRQRTEEPTLNLLELETYRARSKKWRDSVSKELSGTVCTSSAKYQDNLFEKNAVPPEALEVLGRENLRTGGAVEAYIYSRFDGKHSQLEEALRYCTTATPETFDMRRLINSFWKEAGLRRSLDKVYEIIVYSLFETIVDELHLKVEVSVSEDKLGVLREFEEFASKVMCIDCGQLVHSDAAHIYRVGVANAADRGLDMYSNWGPAIQIKHLTLSEELAEDIVDSISSDRIVIVCKQAESGLIISLLNQIGWKSKIQSVVTEDELAAWYDRALRGTYGSEMGQRLLDTMAEQLELEFPSTTRDRHTVIERRNYGAMRDDFWK